MLIGIIFLKGSFHLWILSALILILFLWIFIRNGKNQRAPIWEIIYLILSLVCGAFLGGGLARSHSKPTGEELIPYEGEQVLLLGEIDSPVKKNAYGEKCFLQIAAIQQDDELTYCKGKVLLYFPRGQGVTYSRFDSIWVKGSIRKVKSKYPSYLSYLHKKGITHCLFASDTHRQGSRKGPLYWSQYAQKYLSAKLVGFLGDTTTQSIGLAITIGDKENLSPEIREVFSHAGASHILAISGLHVGIIYLVLTSILSFLHAFRGGKKIKYVLILLSLQAYMFITGASPAVVRAVIMFSTILIFQLSSLRYHILNVVALSALVQLVIHPDILYEVGFQLSYLAVIGIVWAYPYFEKIFEEESWLVKSFMATLGVSLFASLFTAPVIWMVFGQFPTYFLLTNLLLTIVSFITVLSGFVTLCLLWYSPLAALTGWICQKSIWLMVCICEWVISLPSPLIEVRDVDPLALLLLAGQLMLVVACVVWVKGKKRGEEGPFDSKGIHFQKK